MRGPVHKRQPRRGGGRCPLLDAAPDRVLAPRCAAHRPPLPPNARCCASALCASCPPLPPPPRRSILYQRGIYPHETFVQKKQYGLAMMVTKDDGLLAYMSNVTKQMSGARLRPVHWCTCEACCEALQGWT